MLTYIPQLIQAKTPSCVTETLSSAESKPSLSKKETVGFGKAMPKAETCP